MAIAPEQPIIIACIIAGLLWSGIPLLFRRGSRILKWGVNFLHLNQRNQRNQILIFEGWEKKKKEGGSEKGGWKFSHFTSLGSAPAFTITSLSRFPNFKKKLLEFLVKELLPVIILVKTQYPKSGHFTLLFRRERLWTAMKLERSNICRI